MFTKALSADTKKSLAVLSESGILKNTYLSGGTAIALQIGHRISVDLDFFTPDNFSPEAIAQELSKIGRFREEQISKGTITGQFNNTKFSLFLYRYKLLYRCKDILGIKVADLRDIAAMKIAAISARGYKRDFIDIYFLSQKFSLKETLQYYRAKYGMLASNMVHIQKSLVYFDDAENDQMPKMLKQADWNKVKSFFIRNIKVIARNNIKNGK